MRDVTSEFFVGNNMPENLLTINLKSGVTVFFPGCQIKLPATSIFIVFHGSAESLEWCHVIVISVRS